MSQIEVYVADVIDALDKGKNPWIKCFERLGRFYDKKFGGKDWREKKKNSGKKEPETSHRFIPPQTGEIPPFPCIYSPVDRMRHLTSGPF